MIRRLILMGLLIAAPLPATAQQPLRGVALVIGESKYQQLPALANPGKDARDIDRLLGDLGFEVDRVLNADGAEIRAAIARFEASAKDADVALIYYSGHGIEAKGQNFIAPTDTDLSSPERAGNSMIAVQPILDELAKAAPVSIVLLDACRSDPFPPGQTILLPGESAPTPVEGQGLVAIRGPTPVAAKALDPDSFGAVIGFSASPGEPALDGPAGENSPYAAALIKHFAAGGYSFGDVMTMVSEEVYLKTKAKQLPWTNSSLRRVLTFDAPAEDQGDSDQRAIRTERRKLLLTIAATPAQTQKYVEALAGSEKVPLDALYGMLGALGIKTTGTGVDLEQQLQQGAERLKQLMADRPQSVKSDAELERLSKLADDAEAEGAIGLALEYRDQASARADTLLLGKQAEAERLRQDMIDIADTYAMNASTATLNFDHAHAADLYGKAFEAAKDWDRAKAIGFKVSQGEALTDQGYYVVDNGALKDALARLDEALQLAPRDSDPDNWGRIRDRIGQAQGLLGTRLGDRTMLAAAVTSFTDALAVETREHAPDRWAATENNLGNILYDIGYQSGDRDALRRSVAAFDAALEVYTQEASPSHWATAQSNRGGARVALANLIYAATGDLQTKAIRAGRDPLALPEVVAAREEAVAILSDVIATLKITIGAQSRASDPLGWAISQNTLAGALSERAKLTGVAEDLKASADAYREILTVHDKVRTPVQWSIAAANLASTLRNYAGLIKARAPLDEAAGILREAIALTPRGQAPTDWAEFQSKLGNVLSDELDYELAAQTVDDTVAAYKASQAVRTPDVDIDAWGLAQLNIVSVLLKAGVPNNDLARVRQARDEAMLARDVLTAHHKPDAEIFGSMLPTINQYVELLSK